MDRSRILRNLATPYDVIDSMDGTTSKVFVINSSELFKVMKSLPARAKQEIKGIKKSAHDISWYCSRDEEYIIESAIAQAKIDGNDLVVVELISWE